MDPVKESDTLASQEDAVEIYLHSLLAEQVITNEPSDDELIAASTSEDITRKVLRRAMYDANSVDDSIKTPAWAEKHFSCLPIDVSGITLYLPLRQVRTVKAFPESIEVDPMSPDWVMGKCITSKKTITVIDIQKIIFQASDLLAEPIIPSKLVLINGGDWGIACEQVGNVQQLSCEEINWRSKNAEQHWIAGSSKKHMTAIIDTKRIEFAMAIQRSLV